MDQYGSLLCPCSTITSGHLVPPTCGPGIPIELRIRRRYSSSSLAFRHPRSSDAGRFDALLSRGPYSGSHLLKTGSALNLESESCKQNLSKRRVKRHMASARCRCAGGLNEATEREGDASTRAKEGATEGDGDADADTQAHCQYMRMAVQLARKAIGHTAPNPMVGCVIVKDGEIVGRGFHPKAGEPHAEVFALREAGKRAEGATAYVSLEPCNHTGRTPPCSQALVKAQVKQVVVGTVDPNPLVGGQGVQTLRNAGIHVVVGVEEALCKENAETFFHRIVTKKPFLTLRYTMSLDGAFLTGCDYGVEAGQYYSRLLQEHDAVIIEDSCLVDDPILLSSEAGAKQPLRVVLAKSLNRLPLDSCAFDTTLAPTLVLVDSCNASCEDGMSAESLTTLRSKGIDVVPVNELNLDFVLDLLYQKGFNSVLLDLRRPTGVSGTQSCLEQFASSVKQVAQKLVVVLSPVIVGEEKRESPIAFQDELLKLQRVFTKTEGGYTIIEGYVPIN